MAILNEGIRKAAMWAPIQFKRDRPNEDLRLPSVIIFKDNVCEMKIGVFNLKDIFNIISHKVAIIPLRVTLEIIKVLFP